jgi:hypothetical protein
MLLKAKKMSKTGLLRTTNDARRLSLVLHRLGDVIYEEPI